MSGISLGIIPCKAIYVAANGILSLFFYGRVTCHCTYVPSLSTHSSMDNLSCFHTLAIINSAAVSTGAHVFLQVINSIFIFFG